MVRQAYRTERSIRVYICTCNLKFPLADMDLDNRGTP